MLAHKWLTLLRANLGPLVLLSAAFAAPMILTDYRDSLGLSGLADPQGWWWSALAVLGEGAFACLPFAVYRATVGEAVGLAITNTVQGYRQVLQYWLLLIPRVILAFAIALGLTLAAGRLTGTPWTTWATAYMPVTTVLFEIFRFRLLSVPPILVATGRDRKHAAKLSRVVTRYRGAFPLFALSDLLPVGIAYALSAVLPARFAFWLVAGAITVAGGLSAALAVTLWMVHQESSEQPTAGN